MFPEDIGEFYFSMDFYDYRAIAGDRSSPIAASRQVDPVRRLFNADRESIQNQIAKPSSFARIKLPIPLNLKDNFRINYENAELGGTVGAFSAIWEATKNLGVAGSNMFQGISADEQLANASDMGAQGLLATGKGIANYLTEKNVLFGANVGGLWDLGTGTAVNPNLTVLFRGPTLKTHTFEWHLTPRTPRESENIRKIIAIIKRAMHPERLSNNTSAILRYPSECLIEFVGRQKDKQLLYPLRPAVVEGASFDYAPNNVLAFMQDTDDSGAINISITVQETSYYTRDSFDNAAEYGSDGYDTGNLTNGSVDAFGKAPE